MVQKLFSNCCGCGSCASTCPVDAIHMSIDDDGFYKPYVDQSLCVNCGACLKACPLNLKHSCPPTRKFYACRAMDKSILSTSSSGGVFPLLANMILQNGGVVYGCAWNNDGLPEHIQISNIGQIELLTGSKYVQSNTTGVYAQVKADLIQGKLVLFSGTPCQVAGLLSFLKHSFSNLVTVDFICHGTPSTKAYQSYLREIEAEYGATISSIHFRDKSCGWKALQLTAHFNNGNTYSSPAGKDSYYRAFLSNLSLNKVCGSCSFNTLPRRSDITLGDFWNIENHHSIFSDDQGASCVIINTESGERLFSSIQPYLIKEESSYDSIVDGNPFLNGHCLLHKRRDKFFSLLGTTPFTSLVETCLKLTPYEWVKEILQYKLMRHK